MPSLEIIPAILETDVTEAVRKIESVRELVEWVQLDVTDTTFADVATFPLTDLPSIHASLKVEVDLMVADPAAYLQDCYQLGVQRVSFHIESVDDPQAVLDAMAEYGFERSISLKPDTPISDLEPYIDQLDMVLLHSVEPGKQGQVFIPQTLQRIEAVRTLSPDILIEVDGGVNEEVIQAVLDAGADIAAIGSALFEDNDPQAALDELQSTIG